MTTTQAFETFSTKKSDMKIASNHVADYYNSYATDLYDVYTSFSKNKVKAFEYCKELCSALDGVAIRILSHNSNVFTVGFEFNHPETNKLCFAYITKDYNRYCELD